MKAATPPSPPPPDSGPRLWHSPTAGQITVGVLAGLALVILLVLGYQILRVSLTRSMETQRAQLRLEEATRLAGDWLAGNSPLDGQVVEYELSLALVAVDEAEGKIGRRVLEQVRQRRAEPAPQAPEEFPDQQAVEIWDRIQLALPDQPERACQLLGHYLEVAGANANPRAAELLADLQKARDNAYALQVLLQLSDAEFQQRNEIGRMARPTWPNAGVNEVFERTLTNNLAQAEVLRQLRNLQLRLDGVERSLDRPMPAKGDAAAPQKQGDDLRLALQPEFCQPFLERGDMAEGQRILEDALRTAPDNDQIRFSLAALQFFAAVEELGQSFYHYGLKSEVAASADTPFLRIPVPSNPDPAIIKHETFRQILEDFVDRLREVDDLLSPIDDPQVRVHLQLARVKLDFDRDGNATEELGKMARTMWKQEFAFLQDGAPLEVHFDLADAAWLRIYCNLMASILESVLAIDTEPFFDMAAPELFARPWNNPRKSETPAELVLIEPNRLEAVRLSLIEITKLNEQMWTLALAESDNDFEWIPNPLQKSVLGIHLQSDHAMMWVAAMPHVRDLLEGKSVIGGLPGRDDGLNLRRFLQDPPQSIPLSPDFLEELDNKYFTKDEKADLQSLFLVIQAYQDWFN